MIKTALKRYRAEMGLSQAELATKLGVAQSTIAQWETGVRTPRARVILAIAGLINCTVDDLLRDGGEEEADDDTGVKKFG